jgi:hypothetical protein
MLCLYAPTYITFKKYQSDNNHLNTILIHCFIFKDYYTGALFHFQGLTVCKTK